MTIGALPCPITSTCTGAQPLTEVTVTAGEVCWRTDLPAGLYQFSVVMNAADFDWEQLYEVLNKYHNQNERTGPWDFSINHGAIPLVPSYWVSVNGRQVGLWFFERLTLEDLARRRFRGKFAFYADGATEVRLRPYTPSRLEPGQPPYDWNGLVWQSAVLEVDPEDLLAELPAGIRNAEHTPAAAWGREDFWAAKRRQLATSHAVYQAPLRRSWTWLLEERLGDEPPGDALPGRHALDANDLLLLIMAWRLDGRAEGLARALDLVDQLVDQPAWSNPNPEGYSHNGDMGAMYGLRALMWAWHALGGQMGEVRRQRVRDKLRRQGGIFFDLILLNRDYWGGSVVQDHGWKSLGGFGVVALGLLGVLPEATLWARLALPRLRRCLDAMPRDGVIPGSSHYHQYLYLDEVTQYREALLAATGEDIFQEPQFHPIVDFMATALHPEGRYLLSSPGDQLGFCGSNHFLNAMASLHADGRAAWLQAKLLEHTRNEFYHATMMYAHYLGAAYGFLTYDPGVAPVEPVRNRSLRWFRDSGLVHYYDEAAGVTLAVQCGPYSGMNSYLHTPTCGCDRLGVAPGQGHFTLFLQETPVLCSPDGGYSLRSALRSVLLVEGRGQHGDIGYPMSIPRLHDRGAQVVAVRWDETSRQGWFRLWLAPAYDEELGVAQYYRDFLVGPGEIVVRDLVTLDEPRRLSWLFQGKEDLGLGLEGLQAHLGRQASARLTPRPVGLSLTASLHPTRVVWSYASGSGFRPFQHVRYDTVEPVTRAEVDFVLEWP